MGTNRKMEKLLNFSLTTLQVERQGSEVVLLAADQTLTSL